MVAAPCAEIVMNPVSSKRVRESYASMAGELSAFVDRVYDGLFEASPEARSMFPADISAVKGHFGAAIALIARNVERLGELAPALAGLGQRHAAMGVKPEHYALLQSVVMKALAQTLATRWTPKTSGAWDEALQEVCGMMQGEGSEQWRTFRTDHAKTFPPPRPGAA